MTATRWRELSLLEKLWYNYGLTWVSRKVYQQNCWYHCGTTLVIRKMYQQFLVPIYWSGSLAKRISNPSDTEPFRPCLLRNCISKTADTIAVWPCLVRKCISRTTFEKWALLLLFFIKKWTFMKDFLNFQGPGKLWEVKNWIWDSFLS